MTGPIIQSAVNFSEGRRSDVIAAILEAAAKGARSGGAVVADWSADPDHNRMVVSILGAPAGVRAAVAAASGVAVERIDLREHTGAHPRIGAVDVIPVTPIRDVSEEDCRWLARAIGEELAAGHNLPVYFYELSAAPGRAVALPDLRKGGFEGLFVSPLSGHRAPDLGPHMPHPTAGAMIVGARPPLVAYNIDLDTMDAAAARRIAAEVRKARTERPELAGVRALGLWLPTRGCAQVSMNLTRPDVTSLPVVFGFVRESAQRMGVDVRGSEIIGLIPRAALDGQPPESILWKGFRESQVIETWLG